MTQKYDKSDILRFLRKLSVMNVAVVDGDKPISTVLLFAVDDNFNFCFATHKDSHKAKAIRSNPKISLSVWEHTKMLVQADGLCREISDEVEIHDSLESLAKAADSLGDFWPPVLRFGNNDYSVFSVKLNWMRILDLSSNTIHASENPFIEIEM